MPKLPVIDAIKPNIDPIKINIIAVQCGFDIADNENNMFLHFINFIYLLLKFVINIVLINLFNYTCITNIFSLIIIDYTTIYIFNTLFIII